MEGNLFDLTSNNGSIAFDQPPTDGKEISFLWIPRVFIASFAPAKPDSTQSFSFQIPFADPTTEIFSLISPGMKHRFSLFHIGLMPRCETRLTIGDQPPDIKTWSQIIVFLCDRSDVLQTSIPSIFFLPLILNGRVFK